MLAEKLKNTAGTSPEPKPIFFDLKITEDQAKLENLLDEDPRIRIIDTYETQLQELFVLEHPSLHDNATQKAKEFAPYREAHYAGQPAWQAGTWAYIPWRSCLLHLLDDDGYQQVRTARNLNLITAEEQKKFYNSTIGIAGLSVGNSVTLSIVLTGGGKRLRLADPDTLELTNLNRIRGSIVELTEAKVYMSARQIYELDPYADLTLYPAGLTEENIQQFFDGPPKLDVVIDEIDNIAVKFRIREEAKKRGIPVLMAADNGESGTLDIERYDLTPEIEPFHGRAPKQQAPSPPPRRLLGMMIANEFIGADVTESRTLESVMEIGNTLPTWPQLGGAALLNGVAVAAATRKILTNQPVIDNRAILSLSAWLVPGYDGEAEVTKRKRVVEKFAGEYNQAIEEFLGSQN